MIIGLSNQYTTKEQNAARTIKNCSSIPNSPTEDKAICRTIAMPKLLHANEKRHATVAMSSLRRLACFRYSFAFVAGDLKVLMFLRGKNVGLEIICAEDSPVDYKAHRKIHIQSIILKGPTKNLL